MSTPLAVRTPAKVAFDFIYKAITMIMMMKGNSLSLVKLAPAGGLTACL